MILNFPLKYKYYWKIKRNKTKKCETPKAFIEFYYESKKEDNDSPTIL